MRMLNEAHDVIEDPERRARYDLEYTPAPPFARYAPSGRRPPPSSWDVPLQRRARVSVRPRSFGRRQNPTVYVIGLTVIVFYMLMLITGAIDQGKLSAQTQPTAVGAVPSARITREEVRSYLSRQGYVFAPADNGGDMVLIGLPECNVAAIRLLGSPLERMTITFSGDSSAQALTQIQSECLSDLAVPVLTSLSDQTALVRWLASSTLPLASPSQIETIIGGWQITMRRTGSDSQYELGLESIQ